MRIVIVDDDQLVALSLKTILENTGEVEVCALGKNGHEAVALYETHRPDVLLMDIRMDGMSGLAAAETLLASDPEARILLLTTFSDDEYIIKAISIGAKGYILKQDFESIYPALLAVNNGQTVFGTEIFGRIPSLLGGRSGADGSAQGMYGGRSGADAKVQGMCGELSEKESDIVRLVADGYNNKEIAAKLFLSEGTVRNYLSGILEKLGLRDRTQLACYYYKQLCR